MPKVKERGFIAHPFEVRGLLEGRTTLLVRPVKEMPAELLVSSIEAFYGRHPFSPSAFAGTPAEGLVTGEDYSTWVIVDHCGNPIGTKDATWLTCPCGVPDDRLWVRETWQKSGLGWGNELAIGKLHYRATDEGEWKTYWGAWRPSSNMPRWACRILLEVTDVRVTRLQDISPADAAAVGVQWNTGPTRAGNTNPISAFRSVWTFLHGVAAWEANPWVWLIGVRRVEEGTPS